MMLQMYNNVYIFTYLSFVDVSPHHSAPTRFMSSVLVRNDVDLQFDVHQRSSKIIVLVKPMAKTKGKLWNVYEHSFTIQAANLWIKLPVSVATEENLISFKIKRLNSLTPSKHE